MIILDYIKDILDSNSNIHIIFHKEDADGWCSAAIVAMEMFLEYNKQSKFYPYTYGMNLPKLKENDVVFFTDISPKYDSTEFKYMFETVKYIFVCDHHISSAKALLAYNNSSSDIYDEFIMVYNGKEKLLATHGNGIAGCEVAFNTLKKYISNKNRFTKEYIPYFIKIISIYDAWQKDNDLFDYSIKYMNGLMQELFMPTNDSFIYDLNINHWFDLYDDDEAFTDTIENTGGIILQYKEKQAAQACNKSGYKAILPTKIHGNISVVFVNGVGYSSLSFASIKVENFDAMITYNLTKSGWSYSIYTIKNNINCSLIANEFGGGGHAQASGFMLPMTTHPLNIFTDITPLRKKDYVL